MEKACAALMGKHAPASGRMHVVGAGRTDAGVHATGMVAHVDLPGEVLSPSLVNDNATMERALRAHVRKAIGRRDEDMLSVLAIKPMSKRWHARFSSTGKTYTYSVVDDAAGGVAALSVEDMAMTPFVWRLPTNSPRRPLDVPAMTAAAAAMEGTHDFGAFRASSCSSTRVVRTMDAVRVDASQSAGGARTVVRITCASRAFMHHQVRNMVGALVDVGLGKLTVGDVQALLLPPADPAQPHRSRTELESKTAPARGLVLTDVFYANHPKLPFTTSTAYDADYGP
ncbi:tRNA pseudouridine synthase A [Thecamonas trahens ATCC 50062]|uniref:tRNA pseudouridine synthase n=1 Tax=Thecamonas trahens ATCC 50062 TaxID=461836 RepID=A0A0L0D7C2_THETB|nr:tRNA pseudouridine synthase A [Thecamonas trahens ATCC 50062]KNC48080.1 tRNA pseudouridine synthase A [Thecamonas trahens ATCC 50062]|eukprot:XP_013759095.1 tRNA pseudouridine synthase A [Thecamonas trahens ATCC 50062]